jgi:nucleotide-binding universal stress UspA family protein
MDHMATERSTQSTRDTVNSDSAPPNAGGELRVVVGVDGSACATRALMFAAYEAGIRGSLLHIVSAYDIPPSAGWVVVSLGPLEESAAAIVNQSLAVVHEHYPDLVTKGEHHQGNAGSVLVEASRGATLLVVGSRGHSELTNLLIGSISEYCTHHASCPTLIVR